MSDEVHPHSAHQPNGLDARHSHGDALPDNHHPQWDDDEAEQEEKALQRQASHSDLSSCAIVIRDVEKSHAAADVNCYSVDVLRILCAFRAYQLKLGWEVGRWQQNFERLPPRHQALLPDQPAKHTAALECIHANQQVIQ